MTDATAPDGGRARRGPRRLLLLSPFAPRLDAAMGGPRVIAQLVTALAEYERIGLLYLRGADEPPLDERVQAACEWAVETRREADARPKLQKRLLSGLNALAGSPTWVREWRSPAFSMTLDSLVAGWQPDVVQAEFHVMGQYLPRIRKDGPPTVLTEHEPGAAAAADRRRSGLMRGRVLPALEVRAWKMYERRLVRQPDAIVTFTERDRRAMRALGATGRVEVIAPGASIPQRPAHPAGETPPAILFFGNYLHAPNVDAALRLARGIYPLVRAEAPDLRLVLAGDRAPRELTALADESIETPGRVPDLAPYLDRAAVVVAPLRLGGGMRVKVLEAISAGKAVVASSLALEGLDLVHGEHVLRAETDEEFAGAVLRLLRNPEERVSLACRARQWAVENLSWERAARQYDALHASLIRERTAG